MIQWFKCKIMRHKYFFIKRLSDQSRKIGCHSCKKVFAMNDELQIICDWDKDFEEFYEFLNKINKQESK